MNPQYGSTDAWQAWVGLAIAYLFGAAWMPMLLRPTPKNSPSRNQGERDDAGAVRTDPRGAGQTARGAS